MRVTYVIGFLAHSIVAVIFFATSLYGGNFDFTPPTGWTDLKEVPDSALSEEWRAMKNSGIHEFIGANLSESPPISNVNIVVREGGVSLSQKSVDSIVYALKKNAENSPDSTVVFGGEFMYAHQFPVVKVLSGIERNGQRFFQVQYLLSAGEGHAVVTFTTLKDRFPLYAQMFDNSVASIKYKGLKSSKKAGMSRIDKFLVATVQMVIAFLIFLIAKYFSKKKRQSNEVS